MIRNKVELIYSELFKGIPARSHPTIVKILEGAIRAYLKHGFENATFERIAQTAKVSRPLIPYHFSDRHALFLMVLRYIRVKFQQLAVEAILREVTCTKKLEAYVSSFFTWIEKHPRHAKVWTLVYHYAVTDKKVRQIHTELATMGHERICELLEIGAARGEFSRGAFRKRAKMIQALYTGAGMMVGSEDIYLDIETFRLAMVDACLLIAGSPAVSGE